MFQCSLIKGFGDRSADGVRVRDADTEGAADLLDRIQCCSFSFWGMMQQNAESRRRWQQLYCAAPGDTRPVTRSSLCSCSDTNRLYLYEYFMKTKLRSLNVWNVFYSQRRQKCTITTVMDGFLMGLKGTSPAGAWQIKGPLGQGIYVKSMTHDMMTPASQGVLSPQVSCRMFGISYSALTS